MTIKNIITITSVLLVFAAVGYGVYSTLTQKNEPNFAPLAIELCASELLKSEATLHHNDIQQQLTQTLKAQEMALWQDITQETGIDKATCDKRAREYQTYFGKENRAASKATTEMLSSDVAHFVKGIIQECGLDKLEIHLLPDQMKTSPAAADTNLLYITESLFNDLSDNEKKFVIAHELGHIINQDVAHQSALDTLAKERGLSKKILSAVNRFREERADLFAITQGEDYRKGAIEFAHNYHTKYGIQTADTHPKFIQRLSAAQTIDTLYQSVATA